MTFFIFPGSLVGLSRAVLRIDPPWKWIRETSFIVSGLTWDVSPRQSHLNPSMIPMTDIPLLIASIVRELITPLIPGAEWIEREMHDILGITFRNHPNMRRLILSDDWPEGVYPLRKDVVK